MDTLTSRRRMVATGVALLLTLPALLAASPPAAAHHSWGGYHWARTSNPFTLALGDNVSSAWDDYLATTSSDSTWTESSVLDTVVVPGRSSVKRCPATAGRVEVCNSAYGRNGWLGVASIWAGSDKHITQGTVKLNDTYFKTASYDTPAWRNLVMCQEVGHTLGLGHNDEDFSTITVPGTCMDYTNLPDGSQHPNPHDYQELETIYAHTDTTTTVGSSTTTSRAVDGGTGPADWGRAIRTSADGRPSLYERDLGDGAKLFTHVLWADDPRGHHHH